MRRRRLLTAALSGFGLLLWACGSTNEGEYAAGDEDAALADGSGDQTTGDGAKQESAEEDLQSGAESGNDLSSFAHTGSTSYGDDAVPGVSLSADPPEFDEDAARGDARTEVH